MPAITLSVEKRDPKQNADRVRGEGKVPGVYYGRSEETTSIAIDRGVFERTWHEAGESTIITIDDGGGDTVDTLIHDVQRDPVTGAPIHVDFFAFERGKPIEVSIPLEFVGEAPAVKELGGILVKVTHELPISALPKNLPQTIEIDVSGLQDENSQIAAGDIELPAEVTLAEDPESVIAAIEIPTEEPEEEEEEMSIEDIEVEGEKKEEDESDEAGEGESESGEDNKE